MATYSYACKQCGTVWDYDYPIGTALRIRKCTCGGTMNLRIGVGVNISATALETKGVAVRASDDREARWDKDMPAYKRMRHQGMQPAQIDGSAKLENEVGDQFDVHYKPLYDRLAADPDATGVTAKNARERIREGQETAQAIMDDAGVAWKGQPVG